MLHRDAGRHRLAHQQEPRIGQQRRAGVAGQGQDGAAAQHLQEPGQARPLVVLVERQQPLVQPQPGEEPAGAAGVLGEHQVGLLERLARPRRQVLEVADRGGDDDQAAGHGSQ